ncbi:type IV pilin protein [Pseudomonas lalucatii]|nr:type IV pilin protein [Pseudomonas lalucatii]
MRRDEGFTLIELMIVVAVLGILAAIAYPNYTEYMDRARRAEAKTALMEGAQALERYYSVHGSYLDADGNLAQVFSAQAPATGTPNYTLAAEGSLPRPTSCCRPRGSTEWPTTPAETSGFPMRGRAPWREPLVQ